MASSTIATLVTPTERLQLDPGGQPGKNKTIVIVEGPAGSGKSTLIRNTMRKIKHGSMGHDWRIWEVPRARVSRTATNDKLAASESFQNDLSALSTALGVMAFSHPEIAIIDRWGWSQQVYGRLRAWRQEPRVLWNEIQPSETWLIVNNQAQLILGMVQNLSMRFRPRSLEFNSLRVHTLFYLPTLEELERRRSLSAKVYKHEAFDELEGYLAVARTLQLSRWSSRNHSSEFQCATVFKPEDFGFPLRFSFSFIDENTTDYWNAVPE